MCLMELLKIGMVTGVTVSFELFEHIWKCNTVAFAASGKIY
jgi:uncharacterized membrane protein